MAILPVSRARPDFIGPFGPSPSQLGRAFLGPGKNKRPNQPESDRPKVNGHKRLSPAQYANNGPLMPYFRQLGTVPYPHGRALAVETYEGGCRRLVVPECSTTTSRPTPT